MVLPTFLPLECLKATQRFLFFFSFFSLRTPGFLCKMIDVALVEMRGFYELWNDASLNEYCSSQQSWNAIVKLCRLLWIWVSNGFLDALNGKMFFNENLVNLLMFFKVCSQQQNRFTLEHWTSAEEHLSGNFTIFNICIICFSTNSAQCSPLFFTFSQVNHQMSSPLFFPFILQISPVHVHFLPFIYFFT